MNNMMTFPKTIDEFIDLYTFVDRKEIYTNGSELIQVFRVQQALDHYLPKWISVKERLPVEDGISSETEVLAFGEKGRMGVVHSALVNKRFPGVTHWMPLPEPPEVEE